MLLFYIDWIFHVHTIGKLAYPLYPILIGSVTRQDCIQTNGKFRFPWVLLFSFDTPIEIFLSPTLRWVKSIVQCLVHWFKKRDKGMYSFNCLYGNVISKGYKHMCSCGNHSIMLLYTSMRFTIGPTHSIGITHKIVNKTKLQANHSVDLTPRPSLC